MAAKPAIGKGSIEIGTWPTPERPVEFVIRIPPDLVKEFKDELRIVIRHPWIIGIPIPERLLSKELRDIVGKGMTILAAPD